MGPPPVCGSPVMSRSSSELSSSAGTLAAPADGLGAAVVAVVDVDVLAFPDGPTALVEGLAPPVAAAAGLASALLAGVLGGRGVAVPATEADDGPGALGKPSSGPSPTPSPLPSLATIRPSFASSSFDAVLRAAL